MSFRKGFELEQGEYYTTYMKMVLYPIQTGSQVSNADY